MKTIFPTLKTLTLTAVILFSALFISCENPWMKGLLRPLLQGDGQESGDVPAVNEDPIYTEPSGGGGSNESPARVSTPVTNVSLSLAAPVKNETPAQTAAGAGHFTIGGVTWAPDDKPFQGGVEYAATLTLTAEDGYTFTGLAKAAVNGRAATVKDNTGAKLTLSRAFPATDLRDAISIEILSQPDKLNYSHGGSLDLEGLAATLTFENDETDNIAASNFADRNITTVPVEGDALSAARHDGRPITVRYGSLAADTDTVTVNKIAPLLSDFIVSGTGTFMYNGNSRTVTVRAKEDKTTGNITVKYNGSASPPREPGNFVVTFDVAEDANYTAANGLNAGTLAIYVSFNSISNFNSWLSAQPDNTANTPYNIALNLSDLGGNYSAAGSAGNALYANSAKYVSLNLSGSSITSIGTDAFYHCENLTSVTIPNSVTSIGSGAFKSCNSLISINVDAANNAYSSADGVLYDRNKTTLIQYPAKKTGTSFAIPNSVIIIEDYAFYNCTGLNSVTIGSGVTSIGDGAFTNCDNLTSVIIPNNVTSIGDGAFEDCASLTRVTFQGTIPSSGFNSNTFHSLGDLRDKFYATDSADGTPGTYTTTAPVNSSSEWTKID